MARNTHEATRFTSTQPYAQSKVGAPATTIPISGPAPPNETPSQKVIRLRNAARNAKLGQESRWDKVVLRGRVWADRAHRVTATGLIAASIIATGFAALSFGEMILANRGKKAEWYKQQELAYAKALAVAKQAETDGTLTSDLALFLNKERAIEQAEEEKRRRGSIWQRAKNTAFGELKLEDNVSTSPSGGGNPERDFGERQPASGQVQSAVGDKLSHVMRIADEDSRIVESRQRSAGGPLDRLGERTATSLTNTSKGWMAWIRGQ